MVDDFSDVMFVFLFRTLFGRMQILGTERFDLVGLRRSFRETNYVMVLDFTLGKGLKRVLINGLELQRSWIWTN